ncbi:MAG: hypothetical protein HC906_03270 [Bacteroidales bacterium]|nr:hypothetical protein [Bacteroidales bacterium]
MISTTSLSKRKNLKQAFQLLGININRSFKNESTILFLILDIFRKTITRYHDDCRHSNIAFPEVEIREIWKDVLDHSLKNNYIEIEEEIDVSLLTLIFELINNQVYPMPGMMSVINRLTHNNMPLGIVSNAQFYTPVIMNYFISGDVKHDEQVLYFDPELQSFSYKYRIAKPDTKLFEFIIPVLDKNMG